jgi:hypothetical protein
MAKEIYRQRKTVNTDDFGFDQEEMQRENKMSPTPTPNPQEESNPLERIQAMQNAMARETGRDLPEVMNDPMKVVSGEQPFEVTGSVPPAFKEALSSRIQQVSSGNVPEETQKRDQKRDHRNDRLDNQVLEGTVKPKPNRPVADAKIGPVRASTELQNVLAKIDKFSVYDTVELPSKSKFYKTIPSVIHVRPMTGEEENILATPRFVKKGKAVDKIFENVIREDIDTEELLSIDRTYLLIFLRGISYTPEYDVEVKCPSCDTKFNTVIDLNNLEVDMCPEEFGPDKLEGVLPRTGLAYKYRLATGDDEQMVTRHREVHIREFGDQKEDDTLLYRSALLLEFIDEVDNTNELLMLLRKLPVEDVNYIRNTINEPPFGVETDIGLICPSCTEEFEIALPLEANFFFPRKKTE